MRVLLLIALLCLLLLPGLRYDSFRVACFDEAHSGVLMLT